MDIEIVDERHGALGQYHLLVDGVEVGELDYRDGQGRRVFSHTGVRPEFEGRGLAAQLVRRALSDARDEEVKVVPQCSFVARFIASHPQYDDLVAPAT
jgi:hypothetical protein